MIIKCLLFQVRFHQTRFICLKFSTWTGQLLQISWLVNISLNKWIHPKIGIYFILLKPSSWLEATPNYLERVQIHFGLGIRKRERSGSTHDICIANEPIGLFKWPRSALQSPHIDDMKTVLLLFVVFVVAAAQDAGQGKKRDLSL